MFLCNQRFDESFADMSINKNKLLENFKNIKNFMNFNILKCYNKLFTKEGILNNIGFYLILVIILFHIITIFIFKIKLFQLLLNKINNILYEIEPHKKHIYNTKNKNSLNANNGKKRYHGDSIFP